MSAPAAYVSVELDGVAHRAGQVWVGGDRGREHAAFEYDASWLASPHRFPFDPALTLAPGPFHTAPGRPLFGALADSAPDRWGRTLVARHERRRARAEERAPRTLREIDYLLAIADETRLGALRFSVAPDGPFLAVRGTDAVPPLVALPRLVAAANNVLDNRETGGDLDLLLAPGSSLGGARPKAAVRDKDGSLLIAKFPARADEYHVVEWEAVALALAHAAGMAVPPWRLIRAGQARVLLVRRFDRDGRTRVPFLSAMSALDARDGEPRSYLEIADVLRTFGASVRSDLAELWRRVVFGVLVSNTDDHLRNHGFLYAGPAGWRLSPAYDLNPVPRHIRPRVLSTAITADGDLTASLEAALGVASHFGVPAARARAIAREVGTAVRRWRHEAAALKIGKREADEMASAFEHEDLDLATRG